MIVQFVFFIGIAATCFSGLLFTLWVLAHDSSVAHEKTWTLRSIAWLIVQIWFGSTYVAFDQAASFHPLFGPILITIFAALSNTLLVTILISILSNTVAKIGANATQEYLFQFAISTIEGVKTDALFSYQPPFNILAFLILKPASWFLSPRALHSVNVFLIRVTSLPQLVAITIYERHLAAGQQIRKTSKDAAETFFQSLPRHIKNMPLVEALVGPSSNDLYDAIFDMEVGEDETDLFGDYDDGDEVPTLRSFNSRENLFPTSQNQGQGQSTILDPTSPSSAHPSPGRRNLTKRRAISATRLTINPNFSPKGSPRSRPRVLSAAVPTTSAVEQKLGGEGYGATATAGSTLLSGELYVPPSNGHGGGPNNGSMGLKSPLARFFSQRTPSLAPAASEQMALMASAEVNASVRRVESLLEDVKEMPVAKLKEEMKELQERQARIENLLMMLTRGMRNDNPRHDSI